MNEPHRTTDIEMDRLIQALEAPPSVPVPDDFSARVMARVPLQRQRRYVLRQSLQKEAHVGRSLVFVALLVLVAAMLVLAPHTTGSETWMVLQGVLFIQLVALVLWIGISYRRLL